MGKWVYNPPGAVRLVQEIDDAFLCPCFLEHLQRISGSSTAPCNSHYRPQRSWGKVMFLQASVILLTGGVPDQVHPTWTRYTPHDQIHPPWDQVHPLTRYPPRPGTTPQDQVPPQKQVHPPRTRHTLPGPGTPPGIRYTPQPGNPPGPGTPPRTR